LKRLSIVIPLLNEEQSITELYERLRNVCKNLSADVEIIFIDDGSSDRTSSIIRELALKEPKISFISFTRNFGHQIAIHAGLENSKGDFTIIMDGDLQDPPELIPELLNTQEVSGAEVVLARRKSRKNESAIKKGMAALFYRILNKLSNINIPIDTGDFRLISAKVVKELVQMKEPNKFMRGQVAWLGYKTAYIEFDRDGRESGSSQYTTFKMIKLALDGLTGFSNFPLKFATISGISISTLSFFLIFYVLISKYVFHEAISGWASIMVAVLFIGGIQLLSVGIIGEYISRINDSVRDRPMYIIKESKLDQRNENNLTQKG
jgi:polyisoprenyl-phosphate glycosyltransferase